MAQMNGYNWNNPTYQMGGNQQMPQQYQSQYPMNMQMANQNVQQGITRPQIFYIPGRSVNDSSEVQPYEVPMDSPMSLFPKNDRSEIYVKYWGEKGIETDVYVKVDKSQASTDLLSQSASVPEGWFNEQKQQLDRIEKMLKFHNKPRYNKNKTKNTGGDEV